MAEKCQNCGQVYDGGECKNPNKDLAVAPCPFTEQSNRPKPEDNPFPSDVEEV